MGDKKIHKNQNHRNARRQGKPSLKTLLIRFPSANRIPNLHERTKLSRAEKGESMKIIMKTIWANLDSTLLITISIN